MAEIVSFPNKPIVEGKPAEDGPLTKYTIDYRLDCVMAIYVEARSVEEAVEAAEEIGLAVWDQLEEVKTDPRAYVGFDDLQHLNSWLTGDFITETA